MILTESTITIISLVIIALELIKTGIDKSATLTKWKNVMLDKVRPPKVKHKEEEEIKLVDINLD